MAKQARYGMAPEGYDWYEMLRQYKAFKDAFKRNPKSSGASSEEVRLYYWMYNQTRLIKNGHMSDEHMSALIKAGVDIPNKGNLHDKYVRNVKSIKASSPSQGDELYKWAVNQSRMYNEKSILKWRRDIWDKETGSDFIETFGVSNQNWIRELKGYSNVLKNPSDTEEYVNACIWLNYQVELLGTGKLYDWKVRYIENEGLALKERCIPNISKKSILWAKNYLEYSVFLKENGRRPRCSSGRSASEKALRNWAYTEIKAIRRGARTDLEIKKLADIGIVA